MIWILYCLAIIVGLVLGAAVTGMFLPRNREVKRTAKFENSIDQVWNLMTNHANDPKWRTDLKQVLRLEDRGGQQVWQEIYKNGNKLSLQTTRIIPNQELVRQIVDNKQFGGTWNLLFESDGKGCRVSITENSELYNPIFRFMAMFMKPGATIELYLKFAAAALGTELKEEG